MQRFLNVIWAPLFLFLATPAWGQIWVPAAGNTARLPHVFVGQDDSLGANYHIKELEINGRIRDQVGDVTVSQTFVNTGSEPIEVEFVFPLPADAAVDNLLCLINGAEYQGQLMSADEAREILESYIRQNQDPALLEWLDHGMFKTGVFPVPAGAERKVTIRYSQILDKDHTLTDFLFPMSTARYTAQAVEKVSVRFSIESSQSITSVYSPTHQVTIERPGAHQALVTYEATDQVPTNDFRLMYDTASNGLSASVISYRPDDSQDGFFLMLTSPEIRASEVEEEPLPKTVVFVIDHSYSMQGEKFEQAREALKFVINNLREGDLFNIVAYEDTITTFAPELMRLNDETRQQAIGFTNGIVADNGTNIDGALTTAFQMLKDDEQPSYVVFLTDGRPTYGERNEMKIVENTQANNTVRARLISLGVGYDVNSRLLERLTRANFGQGEFVRPDEDIEAHVAKLYSRISSPVLSNVTVDFGFDGLAIEDGPAVTQVYPQQVYDLFEGNQLVLVGRYKHSGPAEITITGAVGGQEQSFTFPANFVESSNSDTYGFVAKLWAMRRIGDIVDEIDLTGHADEELVAELVQLSTTFGILTPYTAFLADEQAIDQPLAGAQQQQYAAQELQALEQESGQAGFAQRCENNQFQFADSAGAAAQGGYGGGYAGGKRVLDAASDSFRSVDDVVQSVGNEALYRRGNVWIAGNAHDVCLTEDTAEILVIEQFSEEYFELVAANTAAENAVLATQREGEGLVVRLRDQVYRIQ